MELSKETRIPNGLDIDSITVELGDKKVVNSVSIRVEDG